LKAVHCREQLQKIGDPSNEAQICQDLFAGFVTKEQAAKIYRDLYEDSRSYPGSWLPFPLLPETISFRRIDLAIILTSPVQRSAAPDRGMFLELPFPLVPERLLPFSYCVDCLNRLIAGYALVRDQLLGPAHFF
jgi:hypothetical protein